MQTQTDERPKSTSPRRSKPRTQTQAWQRDQLRMVEQIADHVIAGGASRAGPGADDEQAIDAYLEVLKRDLLAFAKRGG